MGDWGKIRDADPRDAEEGGRWSRPRRRVDVWYCPEGDFELVAVPFPAEGAASFFRLKVELVP